MRASDGLHPQLQGAVASIQIPLRVRLAGWEAGILARCTFLPFLDLRDDTRPHVEQGRWEARASLGSLGGRRRTGFAVELSDGVKSSQGSRTGGRQKCRGQILHIDERRGRVCSGVAIKSSRVPDSQSPSSSSSLSPSPSPPRSPSQSPQRTLCPTAGPRDQTPSNVA
jgi:hypothetical protein